ncbi:MAG: chorismate lyase [Gammaproteobacteria bacterium]|nr:chorismate lyase [Gammaproteobacteria bacterium]
MVYQGFNCRGGPRWRPLDARLRRRVPAEQLHWLVDAASLTQRLRRLCPHGFRVRLLAQRWQRPAREERRALGLRDHEFALVREVHLACGETPWVFARTVIPAGTLRGELRRFARLGDRPLGELLFSVRGMRREAIEVAEIRPGHALHRALTGGRGAATIWGRRSAFTLAGHPLLVGEIFLPSLTGRRG